MSDNNQKPEKQNQESEKIVLFEFISQTLSSKIDEAIVLTEVRQKIGLKDIIPHSETQKDLIRYLVQLAPYPSTEKAIFHRQSNRIGMSDSQQKRQQLRQSRYQVFEDHLKKIQNCKCCGLVRQDQELEICANSFKDVVSIGISTYLFYRTMINLLSLLSLAFMIFGIYALASNISSSNQSNSIQSEFRFQDYLMISLGSKIYLAIHDVTEAQTYLIVQVWLGYAMVVSFLLTYLLIERIQVTEVSQVQALNKSAADFTLVFKGVPMNAGKQAIQKQIMGLLSKPENNFLKSEVDQFFGQYKESNLVAKINFGVPRYHKSMINYKTNLMQKQKIKEKQKQFKAKVVSWIMELTKTSEFTTPKQQREELQNQFKAFRKKNSTSNNDLISFIVSLGTNLSSKNIKQILKKQSLQADEVGQNIISNEIKKHDKMTEVIKTDVFVTFESRKIKQDFLNVVGDSIIDKIRSQLTFHLYRKKVPLKFNEQTFRVRIEQASEPEDVIWENIGVKRKQIFMRKFIISLITFLILGASFVTVYALSTVQYNNQENRYISLLISFVLPIFNLIIKITLQILTVYELDSTHTAYQSSLAIKTIIAQLTNTIAIPILVNHFLKSRNYLYEKNGLAQDIFLLGLTNSFLPPILKILDPKYIYVKYINVWLNERPINKFFLSQKQLNKVYQLMEFETGIQYVYLITVYLFTCFFMSLQPIIIIFAICGYVINFWVQKYCLFHRSKRPVPGTRILYDRMVQFVYAGGLFYSVGSLCFVNLIPENLFENKINQALIANLVALGVSVLIMLVPFSAVYNSMIRVRSAESEGQLFSQDRVFLPSQYDRMNPDTKKNAIEEYIDFIEKAKKKFKKDSDKEKKQFEETFKKQDRYILNLKDQFQYNQIISNLVQDSNRVPQRFLFDSLLAEDSRLKGKNKRMEEEHEPKQEKPEQAQRQVDMSQIMLSVSQIVQNQTSENLKQSFFEPQQSFHQLQNNDQ